MLRNLAANGQGTLSQSFNQAFAGGGSGVALRGLTVGATLTLIDGERMIPYPLSDDGQRSFVDVTSLPLLAVDRIDVLKDSASAEYGSDAIAGVVNVILKKSFTGFQFSADAGTTRYGDGTTERLSGIAGIGDLANDGYNAWITLEWRHQDQILQSNRTGVWDTLDWTPYGGYNNNWGAGTTNPGIINPAPLGGYIVNPAVGGLDPTSAFLGACNYSAFIANKCTYQASQAQLQPQTGNVNVLARITKALGADWQLSFTPSWFRSEAEQVAGAGAGFPTSPYYITNPGVPYQNIAFSPTISTPTLVPANGIVFTVPGNYPGNTFKVPAPIVVPVSELGTGQYQYVTDTTRLFGDLKGSALGFDLDASLGWMYAALEQKGLGFINGVALQTALNDGFVFNDGMNTSSFAPETEAKDTSQLTVLDLHGSRSLLALPGGDLGLALGGGWYRLVKNSASPPTVGNGEQAGAIAFAIGTETNYNAYLEVSAPIIKGLELDAAARYDHFQDGNHAVTPKFGLKYTPFKMITLRGTYGKGFRAPNSAENGNTGAIFGGFQGTDPILCPNPNNVNAPGNFPSQCVLRPIGAQAPGTNLQPEKSTNYTFGFIFRPIDPVAISVDYWDIKVNQDIQSGVNAFVLGANPALFPQVRGPDVRLPFVEPDGTVVNTLTPVGPFAYQLFPYVNFTQTHVNGIDADLSGHYDIGKAGHLTGSVNYTHMFHYIFGNGAGVDLAGTHGPEIISGDTGNPKDRATASLAWDKGPVNLTASVNYVGHFSITDPSLGVTECSEAVNFNFFRFPGLPNAALGNYCTVQHFTTVNLYGQYAVSGHLSLHASVLNLFGTPPPLDLQTYGGPNQSAYDPSMHQAGAVGRFFNVGFNYQY